MSKKQININEEKKQILKYSGLNEETSFTQSDVRRANNRMAAMADKLEDLKAEMEEIRDAAEGFKDGDNNILKGFANFSKSIDQLDKALQSADKAASAGIGRMPKEEPEDSMEEE